MARKGLFAKIQPPPGVPPSADLLSRVQDNVTTAVEQLAADHDVVSAPVARLTASAAIPATGSVVVYSGGPSRILTLPLASALGSNIGTVLYVVNASTVAVTLAATGGNTLNGGASLSLGAGKVAVVVSDGATLWKAVTS